jgi:hypothetical protein
MRILGLAGANFGRPAGDQAEDDGISVSFTTAPLEAAIAICGFPTAHLRLQCRASAGQVAIALCDVWPDGTSTRITGGVLNLNHYRSHEHPEDLEPGRDYDVTLEMKAIAYQVPVGHRVRLSVSAGYWPLMWPPPEPFTPTVQAGGPSALELPVRADLESSADPPAHFFAPEQAPHTPHEVIPPAEPQAILVSRQAETGEIEVVAQRGDALHPMIRLDSGLAYDGWGRTTVRTIEGDPPATYLRSERTEVIARRAWSTRVEVAATMTATSDAYHVTNVLEGFEGTTRVFAKTWYWSLPRDHT